MLTILPSARLACVNVLRLGRLTIDRTLDEQGHNKHVDRLVALKHWASPLKLDENRLTVHVLEAIDPAAAILEFAQVEPGRPHHHRRTRSTPACSRGSAVSPARSPSRRPAR